MKAFRCTVYPNMGIAHKGELLQFVNTYFETEDESLIAELSKNPFVTEISVGFKTVEPVVEVESTEKPSDTDLQYYKLASRITVDDAKRYADERGLAYPEDSLKEDLIAAINLAQADKIK